MFAKVALFSGHSIPRRFFEITNVIRFGFVRNGQIMPVTAEYDFLAVLDECICSYSFKTPKAMKYARASAGGCRCWPGKFLGCAHMHVFRPSAHGMSSVLRR